MRIFGNHELNLVFFVINQILLFQYSERNFSAYTRAVILILAHKTELIITKTVGKIKNNEKKKKKENGTVFDKI